MQQTAVEKDVVWKPNPGPQRRFVATAADECLYGGAAGGGKSSALVALTARWLHDRDFRALLLRRKTTDLIDLLDKARRVFPRLPLGGRENLTSRTWNFASGAWVRFNHCEHDSDALAYGGQEYNVIGFDELTHFSEYQYREIRSRLRTTRPDLPTYTRATSNPGGPGHEWVFRRWGAWLDPQYECEGLAPRFLDGVRMPGAKPGELLWFLPGEKPTDPERVVAPNTLGSQSRTFIPARLEDTPQLAHDRGYRAKLRDLDPVRRAQLELGDWRARPAPKMYWDREKVSHLDAAPSDVAARVRCWDLAASVNGDFTVGARACITHAGLVVLEHVTRFRGTPHDVRARFKTLAAEDLRMDSRTVQWIPQDPGQAGSDQVLSYQNDNPGVTIRARRPTGEKFVRFGPASARAAAGNLALVRGPWNDDLHAELEGAPLYPNDDQMDALSDCVAVLTGAVPASYEDVADVNISRRDNGSDIAALWDIHERDALSDAGYER
jgi:phage terminase large subunit-like protein